MPVIRKDLRALLMAAFSVFALWFLVSPQPAEANIVCNPVPTTLDFAGSLDATFTISYSCHNAGQTALTFTSCLKRGNVQHPGDADQPRMQTLSGPFDTLNFNIFTDTARTMVWRDNNFLTGPPRTLQPDESIVPFFTLYGRIPSGQAVPMTQFGLGFFNENILGFVHEGQCPQNIGDFNGEGFNLEALANLVPSCTLGTIGAIDFGNQPGLFDYADAAGSVQLNCPLDHRWTLTFDGGNNLLGGMRRMRSAADDYLPYTLYSNTTRTSPITVNDTITGTGTGAPQTIPIYGRVEFATTPSIGQYEDSVVVTLSF